MRPLTRTRMATRSEEGFTLLELVVVMSIASVLMGIGIFGFTNWREMAQQQGSASELTSTLRTASVRAVSEGRAYCVTISGVNTYTLWRYTCGTGTAVAGPSAFRAPRSPSRPRSRRPRRRRPAPPVAPVSTSTHAGRRSRQRSS